MTARYTLAIACVLAGCVSSRDVFPPTRTLLELQSSGTTQLLQAVSVVNANVVWVSGHGGTWARTTNGGATWHTGGVIGADTMQFRDVHALDEHSAWLLSAGPGDQSRVYRTDDGGALWTLQWTNAEPDGFYDCLAFWDAQRGIVYGDAVNGELRILRTEDGGSTWRLLARSGLPEALPAEAGFAASGTCVTTQPGGRGWIAAGNAPRARVFRTDDYGVTWSAADVPVAAGEAAGLTSISMLDARTGTAFGGDLTVADTRMDNVARTTDGGRTWTALPPLRMLGAAYGGVHIPDTDGRALLAVGPGGVDASLDGGQTWRTVDGRAWWGIGSGGALATWIVGPTGRIARVRLK